MKIEILGTGCAKCKSLEEVAKQAVAKFGGFHEVKKVEDIVEIMNYGVMSTPALVIDGVVKSSGKMLSVDEILAFMHNS
ncbi:MAG: thioredoxin family protein [Arcobacteraceae bacterium]|jgi:small redox-active disulfide protein 2|nr:thioredoxin family protein [Arcobacteraceae bacterium]